MIKVTLLGDSIRLLGYGNVVPQLLGDEYEVYQPSENCRFSKYTLRGLFDWKKGMTGSRIVHWNNGLWDVCELFGDGNFTSEDEYIQNMLRITDILLANHDKVIFATTTPVADANTICKNSFITRYNDIIVPRLQEKGVIINDLYSLVAQDTDKYISEDTIHLSEQGVQLCAEQVSLCIKSVAQQINDADLKTASESEKNIIVRTPV
ncbi:MAG: SGNH/GDSL hydrolase family protein [Clostridia bacterium]|nr:SGNH/GDSL hydrolase family protein [Clostridia bacterium]